MKELLRAAALVPPAAAPPRLLALLAAAGQEVAVSGRWPAAPLPDFLVVDEALLPAEQSLLPAGNMAFVFTGRTPGPRARALAQTEEAWVEFLPGDCTAEDVALLLARLARRRLEQEARQGSEEAVRREALTFCSRVSHDLQAVFQNIVGFAEALEAATAGRLDERESRFLARMHSGAVRGNSLLLDLAALARIAAGPLEPARVDVAQLVQRCIDELAPAAQGRDVRWRIGDLPVLQADQALLQLALRHLLANALKFSREAATTDIALSASPVAGGWELQVQDQGAGFDPAYADRLFQPFSRLHPAGSYEGNGIGLAQVKAIAERHGARVRAEGAVGRGARFVLEWPQAPAEAAAAPAPVAAGAARHGLRLRVLLVDDDPLVVLTLQNMLARDGHVVQSAGGGAAGIAAARTAQPPFDVVVCDWAMPDLDGGQVALAVKEAHPATNVILLTGRRPDIDGDLQCPPGVDQVLAKPVRSADLRRALDAAGGEA